MFLSRIRIRDFQSIASLDLPVSTNTVLVGETDSGKSAILRAVSTVFTLPRGDLFVRDNAQSCEIHLHFSTELGETIVSYSKQRKTSAQLAIYYPGYQTDPTKSKKWEACQELPPEVAALGISEVKLDSDTYIQLNLADQLEQPFLLSNESLAAKVLGRLSFVDRVNGALRKVNSDLRKDSVAKPLLEKDLPPLEKKVSSFSFLPSFTEFVASVSVKQQTVSLMENQLAQFPLDDLQENDLIERILGALSPASLVKEVHSSSENLRSLIKTVESLEEGKLTLDKSVSILSAQLPTPTLPDLSRLEAASTVLLSDHVSLRRSSILTGVVLPSINFLDVSSIEMSMNLVSVDLTLLRGLMASSTSMAEQMQKETREFQETSSAIESTKQLLGTCPTCMRTF